jgi:hypothetical protein
VKSDTECMPDAIEKRTRAGDAILHMNKTCQRCTCPFNITEALIISGNLVWLRLVLITPVKQRGALQGFKFRIASLSSVDLQKFN